MADLRNDLVKARDAWFESDEGVHLRTTSSLGLPAYAGAYLRNRLEAAFIAGWEARERTVQQRANESGESDAK